MQLQQPRENTLLTLFKQADAAHVFQQQDIKSSGLPRTTVHSPALAQQLLLGVWHLDNRDKILALSTYCSSPWCSRRSVKLNKAFGQSAQRNLASALIPASKKHFPG